MPYDFYKEFDNYNVNGNSSYPSSKDNQKQGEIAYESNEEEWRHSVLDNRVYQYFRDLDTVCQIRNVKLFGMEAGDDPFADIGGGDTSSSGDDNLGADDAFASGNDDPFGGGDNNDPFADVGSSDNSSDPFGGGGSDAGGGSDDPFGGFGSDDGGGDPFGSIGADGGDGGGGSDPFGDMGDGSQDDEKKQASRQIKLDREKTIKEDFNLSRQIRQNFPKKFLLLKDIINNNISILERTVITDERFQTVVNKLVDEYEKITTIINAYLDVIPRKTYDDIFGTYVSVHSAMMRLKKIYIKMCNFDDPDAIEDMKEVNYDNEDAEENLLQEETE